MQSTQENEEVGEPHTTEDLLDSQQLTAADVSSRGGRGKRDRGGGGARTRWKQRGSAAEAQR